jgi:hypothetical protein
MHLFSFKQLQLGDECICFRLHSICILRSRLHLFSFQTLFKRQGGGWFKVRFTPCSKNTVGRYKSKRFSIGEIPAYFDIV